MSLLLLTSFRTRGLSNIFGTVNFILSVFREVSFDSYLTMFSTVRATSVTSRPYYTPLVASGWRILSSRFPLQPAASRSTIREFCTSRLYHTSLVSKEELFNRDKEVKFVTDLLKTNQPQLSLITGPVNSGKTMLLRHVLNELSKEIVAPKILPLNMRELPFLDVDSFVECLSKELSTWYGELSSC